MDAARVGLGLDGFATSFHTGAPQKLPAMTFHKRRVWQRLPGDWRPSPPSKSELEQPFLRGAPQHPGILLAIIGGKHSGASLLHNSSLSRACSVAGITCVVYVDSDEAFDAPQSMTVTGPRSYLQESALPPPKTTRRQCCVMGPKRAGKSAAASGFFCDKHRSATLASQYRFLPAFAHARKAYASRWASGSLSFLVMVDDDAVVNIPLLLKVLGGLDPSVPTYLGDFGEWTQAPECRQLALGDHRLPCAFPAPKALAMAACSAEGARCRRRLGSSERAFLPPHHLPRCQVPALRHALAISKLYRNASYSQGQLSWEPPYACGGAGTVFSNGAVRKLDFLRCAS